MDPPAPAPERRPPPDGGLPLPVGAQPSPPRVVVPARPNYSYFLFMSLLMFYNLINSNQGGPSSASTAYSQTPGDSNSSTSGMSPYEQARYRLLLRESRYEGLARWLGASNATATATGGGSDDEAWLNSTYFPQVTSNETSRVRVMPFRIVDPGESEIVVEDEVRPMMQREPDLEGSVVYPQNLTGFVKGSWEAKAWSYAQLGLNETWTVETTRVRPVEDEATRDSNSTVLSPEGGHNETSSMARRQVDSTLPTSNGTASLSNSTNPRNSTIEISETVFNRTLLRGSFPFTYIASPAHGRMNRAVFNLREVQTSATGPIYPLPSRSDDLDDAELLELRLDDRDTWSEWEKKGPVTYLGGELTMSVEQGPQAGEQTNLDIEAAHLLSSGHLYGYATPSFVRSHLIETVSLPFYANSSDLSSASAHEANVTAKAVGRAMLKETRRRLKNDVDNLDENVAERESNASRGDSDDSNDTTTPQCIFRFYGALDPLPSSFSPSLYREFYASMVRPTGSSGPKAPVQRIRYVLSSTNCGLVLSGSGTFVPTPVLWTRAKNFALLIGFAQAAIVVLLVRHLERTARRPGTVSNVASAGIIVMCIVDAYVFVLLLTAGVVTASTRSSLPMFIPSFLALLSSLLFGMRYVSLIRSATPVPSQAPPAPRPAAPPPPPTREELAARAAEQRARGEETVTEEAVPTEAAPAPRSEGQWELIPTSEKLILLLMLSFLAFSVFVILKFGWIAMVTCVVYSYWIPQIILNVQRGSARQSLTAEFILGTTIARLCLPVYFYAYADNVLDVDTSPWIYVLILYSTTQALVLILQARSSFGPRFFLPRRALDVLGLAEVHTWDYHQALSPAKLADLELDAHEEGGETGDGDGPSCPICMDTIKIRASKLEADVVGSVIANERVRQAYALTPCGHLVHFECLGEWVNVRSICPVCRSGLPSLS
ncbi:hypothetical protein JCM10212_005896 [Sporobolomyces blumeae]